MGDAWKQPRWEFHDLSTRARAAILGFAAADLALSAYCLVDLWRRPARRVRGPKAAWVAASCVDVLGPVSYLVWGRR